MGLVTRAGIAAAIAAAQVGLAYRFALAYRARAGYPRRFPATMSPTDVGLAFETTRVPSGGVELPGWFIPARSGEPGPGVVLIHGWESARDRTLPLVLFLHAAGFHCLTTDLRGPGVVLIHGWESRRDRTLPLVLFLHAAGFHCLTIDIRGHGANPAEELPLSAGEFGLDAVAAFEALVARPEVTVDAVDG